MTAALDARPRGSLARPALERAIASGRLSSLSRTPGEQHPSAPDCRRRSDLHPRHVRLTVFDPPVRRSRLDVQRRATLLDPKSSARTGRAPSRFARAGSDEGARRPPRRPTADRWRRERPACRARARPQPQHGAVRRATVSKNLSHRSPCRSRSRNADSRTPPSDAAALCLPPSSVRRSGRLVRGLDERQQCVHGSDFRTIACPDGVGDRPRDLLPESRRHGEPVRRRARSRRL